MREKEPISPDDDGLDHDPKWLPWALAIDLGLWIAVLAGLLAMFGAIW